ncbi:MAG: hypothetical protein HN344_09955, partial [Gammaproteobacteria bacterium]|nr:hypothetical protein [Gammaproteobacteria bacterium]
GRLWTTPASMTVVDDSAMHNNNLSVGNVVALIGHSTGGAPKTPLRFRSAAEARSVLRSGDLLTAVEKALHPSNQSAGPSYVVAMRVDPALQSSAILAGTGNESMIELLSTGYGVWTQQIQVKVENGSSGETGKKKITTRFGSTYYTADDVGRNAFSVEYSGSGASPTIDISTTSIELKVAGSSVASIDLNSFDKVSQLVDHISSVSGFVASVLEGSGDLPLVNSFETVSGADAADYTVTANRYEAVRWFNSISEGLVDATMLSLNANVITNLSNTADDGFVSLTGGVNGSSVATDWNDCFSALQTEDVQWVVPVTADASVHAMADTHCSFMSDVVQNERRAIVGTATGTTDEAAISAALAINSDRTSLVHLGFYDYATDGSTVLREPYILAALLAGMFSGVNPGTALTNKSINVRGLERKLRNPTDTDRLINGGV